MRWRFSGAFRNQHFHARLIFLNGQGKSFPSFRLEFGYFKGGPAKICDYENLLKFSRRCMEKCNRFHIFQKYGIRSNAFETLLRRPTWLQQNR